MDRLLLALHGAKRHNLADGAKTVGHAATSSTFKPNYVLVLHGKGGRGRNDSLHFIPKSAREFSEENVFQFKFLYPEAGKLVSLTYNFDLGIFKVIGSKLYGKGVGKFWNKNLVLARQNKVFENFPLVQI